MPWEHCQSPAIADDVACPACGITKIEWTIKVGSTRVFKLGAKSCKVVVRTTDGGYAEGAACRMALPDGTVAELELDDGGYAKANSKVAGDVLVSFPGRKVALADEGTGARPAPDAPPGTAFLCPVGKDKHEFRLVAAGRWVELSLVDDRGLVVADEPYVARLADGTLRRGTLVNGLARLEDVPEGDVEVHFPGRDGGDWYEHDLHSIELELLDEAGRPVPNEPFVVRLPDGTTRPGVLDGDGRAKVEGLPTREVEVSFPRREGPTWDLEGRLPEPELPSAPPPKPLELEFRDADGRPIPFAPFRLRVAGGVVVEGRLDRDGRASLHGYDGVACEVTFPEHEASAG
jgi:hypothetical protein